MTKGIKVGLLAMQGAFFKHGEIIRELGYETIEVRTKENLKQADCLIIPGGESSTMGKLLFKNDLIEPLRNKIAEGMPVFGTCAGMILLAKKIKNEETPHIAVMDLEVERNYYGRQKESFEANLEIEISKNKKFNGIFIRAPRITKYSEEVKILSLFEDNPVLVRQGNMLATSFHPELSGDNRIHEYFISML